MCSDAEVIRICPEEQAARRALATAVLLAASAGTTVLFIALWGVSAAFWSSAAMHWLYQISVLIDVPFDAGLALLCAGLVGPVGDSTAELATVGRLVVARRERLIRYRLVEAAQSASGPALTRAALFEGVDPEIIIARAVARFRCISWDVLSTMREVVVGGEPLDGVEAPLDLYTLSELCHISECDAFLSHSWHDNGQQKWEALSGWCEEFKRTHRRSPRLWVDKFCIEQTNIKADLQCLPIFIAGCNLLLVLSGSTYTSRLWCCVELFVYVNMFVEDESIEAPIVITLGADDREHERVRKGWRGFDAAACECFDPEDKKRIFAVVGQHQGGVQGFNAHVRDIATNLFGSSRAHRGSSASSPSASSAPSACAAEAGLHDQGATTSIIPGSMPPLNELAGGAPERLRRYTS